MVNFCFIQLYFRSLKYLCEKLGKSEQGQVGRFGGQLHKALT